ncbi:MAG: hypothetical protein KUG77_17720 [Nannocystaceae bacterium]|nr:hypothetical protein [Nannocystaceae bacterium]
MMPAATATSESPESASDVVRQISARVNVKAGACALAHDVPSGTRVDVELKVSAAGKVAKVQVLPRDPLSGDAACCLKSAIRELVTSPSSTGVNARIPLSL